MCCFTRETERVSDTRIFARRLEDGRQALAYEMTYSAKSELAMVLPLPVPPKPAEDAVRFLDLSGYPDFFADVQRAFEAPLRFAGAKMRRPDREASAMLAVHDVGNFEASFVPTSADFSRLDPRFQLPESFWSSLPVYADWGFAVFKLRASSGHTRPAHPMSFTFPSRSEDELFFPTVHVHDGAVHERAFFDHSLYAQTEPGAFPLLPRELATKLFDRASSLPRVPADEHSGATRLSDEAIALFERAMEMDPDNALLRQPGMPREPRRRTRLPVSPLREARGDWQGSDETAATFVRAADAAGLVDPGAKLWRLELHGELPNADVWAGVPAPE